MHCNSCNHKFKETKFFFGKNFKSNIFEKDIKKFRNYKKYKFFLGECKRCQLIQILNPINFRKIIPNKKWIRNKEEDKHHENFMKLLMRNNLIKKRDNFLFLSEYDNKFFQFLKRNYFLNLTKFDLGNHLNLKDPNYFRQEVIQNFLNLEIAKKFKKKYGSFDFIVSSKLLEHTQNIKNFFTFCSKILNPNGFVLIDVPDCEKSLKQGNITMPWEEHISYFTSDTLDNTLNYHNYEKRYFKSYFYKQENALVGLYQKRDYPINKKNYKKFNFLSDYQKKIIKLKSKAKKFFNQKKKYKYYLFGAGHNAIFFFNYLNLSKSNIEIIDDNWKKNNCFFAGSSKRIKKSDFIKKSKFNSLILLSVNVDMEKKIILNLRNFLKKNDKIYSIYPDSSRFFLKNF